jgi:hypothetical protein
MVRSGAARLPTIDRARQPSIRPFSDARGEPELYGFVRFDLYGST